MSDKKLDGVSTSGAVRALARLEQKIVAANQAYEKGKRIVACLHPTLQPEDFYLSGYSSDGTLQFSAAQNPILEQLLDAYPPVPVVFASAPTPTVKPQTALRENEHGLRAYPFRVDSHAGQSKVVWWHENNGLTLTIEVPGTVPEGANPNPGFWEPQSISYNSGHSVLYWIPRQKRSADLNRLTPTMRWEHAIEDWATNDPVRAKMPALVQYFTGKARYTTEPIIGPSDSPSPKWSETYNSWAALPASEQDAYIEFFTERQQAWQSVQDDEKQQVADAQAWLEAFFAAHGPIQDETLSATALSALDYLLKTQTKSSATLHWVTRTYKNGPFEVALTLNKVHVRFNPTHDMTQPALNLEDLAEYYG